MAGGRRGGGASPVLISRCPFGFPANPETRIQPCALQQAAEKPPVSSKLRRAIKSSFASELASLEAFRYTKTNIGVFVSKRATQPPPPALTLHAHQFLRQPASQPASQAATPCTHAAYSAIKTMLPKPHSPHTKLPLTQAHPSSNKNISMVMGQAFLTHIDGPSQP